MQRNYCFQHENNASVLRKLYLRAFHCLSTTFNTSLKSIPIAVNQEFNLKQVLIVMPLSQPLAGHKLYCDNRHLTLNPMNHTRSHIDHFQRPLSWIYYFLNHSSLYISWQQKHCISQNLLYRYCYHVGWDVVTNNKSNFYEWQPCVNKLNCKRIGLGNNTTYLGARWFKFCHP